MASVTTPKPAAKFHDQNNTVLSATEAKHVVVRYTDPNGQEALALCLVFGEVLDERGRKVPGIFILASNQQLTDQLRRPTPAQYKQLRAKMEERGILGSTSAPEALPDVSGLFDETTDEKKP